MRIEAKSILALCVLTGAVAIGQLPSDNPESPAGEKEAGTVCVLPNSPDPPTRFSPGGEYNPATLTLSIDKGKPIPWPHKHSVKIETLVLNKRHLVVLTSDRQRIQSFWFRFSDFKDVKVCMAFDGYQGVQLESKVTSFWCRCR
jgi:hypothetical protein